jgi:hypothetical protein
MPELRKVDRHGGTCGDNRERGISMMLEKVKVKHDGDENCPHEWVKEEVKDPNGDILRICKLCGRVEKVRYVSEFGEIYRKFHRE